MDKKHFDLLLKSIVLNMIFFRLTIISIAIHCKRLKSADYMNQLQNGAPSDWLDEITDICNEYTALRYSPKKKRFSYNEVQKWNIEGAISNLFKKRSKKTNGILNPFKFSDPNQIEKTIQRLQGSLDNLEVELSKYKNTPNLMEYSSNEEKSDQQLIKDYLRRNPVESGMGQRGVPQSKYRYGTYGLGSMEFDSWSRNSN